MAITKLNLDHPNVLKTLDGGHAQLYYDGEPKAKGYYTVSEVAENGDIFEFLLEAKNYMGGFTPRLVR